MREFKDRELNAVCKEIQGRQFLTRGPRKIGTVINDLIARAGYARVQSSSNSDAAWKQAVGEKMSEQSRPGNVRRGTLEVVVRNSAILQELTFINKKLVRKLAELVPDQKIREIRFRVGKID